MATNLLKGHLLFKGCWSFEDSEPFKPLFTALVYSGTFLKGYILLYY